MYGLRKIINGRPAATDGKEWIIYGDPGFNQGRVAQPEVLHGSLPMEHVRARKFAKAVSAAGMGARGAVASSDAVRAKMTKQKWSKHMAEPTLMDQTCPGVVAREKSKAKSFEEAVAASTAKNPGGSRGPYWTASSELHSPALKLPTFPVAKFFYHGEVLPGSHKDAVGHASHQTRELPKDWLPSCPSNLATEKYRYYSEPMILDSVNFHHTNAGDGLALGRTTYRFSG
mmetsp:Transcript_159983/g.513313  ORF Transcript_159983/g.513313 Transcript_159983/m.513313 type:complete len:229 (-) Transcript_159983:63-749(-)